MRCALFYALDVYADARSFCLKDAIGFERIIIQDIGDVFCVFNIQCAIVICMCVDVIQNHIHQSGHIFYGFACRDRWSHS